MKTDAQIKVLTLDKIHEFQKQLDDEIVSHLYWMIFEIDDMEDTKKANRWLGFIHGQLVALTDCTIDELRDAIREEV